MRSTHLSPLSPIPQGCSLANSVPPEEDEDKTKIQRKKKKKNKKKKPQLAVSTHTLTQSMSNDLRPHPDQFLITFRWMHI